MKYLRTYNESVRDLMKPRSKEDVLSGLSGQTDYDKFHRSAQFGMLSVVKDFMENEDIPLSWKDDALTAAAWYRHFDIVEYLLNSGVPPSNRAFRFGVMANDCDIVKLFLDKGVDPNQNESEAFKFAHNNKFDKLYKLLQKYLKSNESVRDLMKPVPEEEIKAKLDKIISLSDKLKYIRKYKLQKFVGEEELKEMLLNRIHNFFKFSNKDEYLFFSLSTQNIHGIDMFDVKGGTVVGIDDESVILRNDDWIGYEELSTSELENVVDCFIVPIENREH